MENMKLIKYTVAVGSLLVASLSSSPAYAQSPEDKGEATGSEISTLAAKVDGERLSARAGSFDLVQALAGQVAGVNIISGSGQPGTLGSIVIRGNGSMSSSVMPMFVVDGAIGVDPAMINVADIESIQILKDPAYTAMYGVNGANGVVIVNTRKGQGAGSVSFSTSTGAGFLANAPELKKTSWYKDCTRSAIVTNNNLTFSKGDEDFSFYTNIGYQNNQGVVRETGADKLSGMLNASGRIYDWYSIQASMNAVVSNVNAGPWESYSLGSSATSPLASINSRADDTRYVRTNFNLINTFNLLEGLTLKVNGNYQGTNTVNNVTAGFGVADIDEEAPFAKIYNVKQIRFTNEDYLTYSNTFAEGRLQSEFLLGGTVSFFNFEDSFTGAHNLPTDYYGYHNIGLGTQYAPASSEIVNHLYSGWFRTSQVWRNKYALDASVRVDKSSILGKSNGTGVFPAVSGAWTVSEEPFFASAKRVMNLLEFRVSYGLSGNSAFDEALLKSIEGKDLTYESSSQIDAGLDMGFADGRINAVVDWYMRKNTDLVIENAGEWGNLGQLKNTGIELTINAKTIDRENFKWNTDLVFSTYSTKVEKLGGVNMEDEIFRAEEGLAWRRFSLASNSGNAYFGQAAPKGEVSLVNTFNTAGFNVLIDINSMYGHKAFMVPQDFSASKGSSSNLSDASFIRLRTLAVSYDLKHSVLRNFSFVKGLSLGVTAENLFVSTDYSGNDPEVYSTKGALSGLGVDYGAYPKPTVITGNLKISF